MITNKLIAKYVQEGLITARQHNDYQDLVILNYTPKTAFEKHWDSFTLACRGIVFDVANEKVLANPFEKFFNYGEVEDEIDFSKVKNLIGFEKKDGSLGISYFYDGKVRWATRGSFHSDQAAKAQEIWDKKYSHIELPNDYAQSLTLLTEIIYPENKIVVDYGETEDLVLLGAKAVDQAFELKFSDVQKIAHILDMPTPKVYNYSFSEFLSLKPFLSGNEEGFIVAFEEEGKTYRTKIKGDEYVKLHKIIFGLTDKTLFEYWKKGELKELLSQIPEEFRTDYENKIDKVERETINILTDLISNLLLIDNLKISRKDIALSTPFAFSQEQKQLIFKALDKAGPKEIEKRAKDIAIKNILSSS